MKHNYLEITYANLLRSLELNEIYLEEDNLDRRWDAVAAEKQMAEDIIPAMIKNGGRKTVFGAKYNGTEYRIPTTESINPPYFIEIISMLDLPTLSMYVPAEYDLNNECPTVSDCLKVLQNFVDKGYNKEFDNKSIKEILEQIDIQNDIDKCIDETEYSERI